ncbi:hypothetical protein RGQ29_029920 [Quercus rubra]|uniref:Uncharacterized protein n=1 Tax=Quercus rubra TaxID=3512 RepID=A0AAN7IGQ5_QUERU|nr:hypothetical protein RGQ29_029920 [Quercus rubra]
MVLDSNKKFLNAAILIQYVPRVLRICLSWRKIISTDNQLSRIVWVKAAFNFFLYIIASQGLGASLLGLLFYRTGDSLLAWSL